MCRQIMYTSFPIITFTANLTRYVLFQGTFFSESYAETFCRCVRVEPLMEEDKFVNMCGDCEVSFKPLPTHKEVFQRMAIMHHAYNKLTGSTPKFSFPLYFGFNSTTPDKAIKMKISQEILQRILDLVPDFQPSTGMDCNLY